ncbi:MAG: ATP-binding cassette domain-containing protein [Coriobacteriia bacterium]
MSLTLEGIGYTYAAGTGYSQRALESVSLCVAPGEIVLVLGATGSGKSTLLRIAAGLLDGAEGSATIDGEPLTRKTARGRVGMVFQDAESQLFAETVAADVAFGPRNMGRSEAEADAAASEALVSVGLPPAEYGERSPFSLSGGEARRAAIAGVLAFAPRYLLLDEPTAGLDALGRRAVSAIVSEARGHAGIVVVSHSAEEFLGVADRVLVLASGRAVYDGPAADIIAEPAPFADAGLLAPDVLRVQMLARARGHDVGRFTLDPARAAASLARVFGSA